VDGWLARATGTCTPFGAFLDPVADKLATTTAAVLLASRPASVGLPGRLPWLIPAAAAAVVGREVAMSALREWAAAAGPAARAAAAVSWTGKAKTALQMAAIVALLLASGRPCCAPKAGVGAAVYRAAVAVGGPALAAGAVLGLVSLAQYFAALWPWLSGARSD
jgi:CDP-diacylglycerol--glycerol-3-phosphate 3-phosphatidyltransferase